MSITIEISAAQYKDHDDCLQAAAQEYAEERTLQGRDLSPRYADEQRETILLDVPEYAVLSTDELA